MLHCLSRFQFPALERSLSASSSPRCSKVWNQAASSSASNFDCLVPCLSLMGSCHQVRHQLIQSTPMNRNDRPAIVLASGGLDSTTCLAVARAEGHAPIYSMT